MIDDYGDEKYSRGYDNGYESASYHHELR